MDSQNEQERQALIRRIRQVSEAILSGETEAVSAITRGHHQVVTDDGLFHWAPGGMVKIDTAITKLGFIDVLGDESVPPDVREAAIASFRAWAADVREVAGIDMEKTLERKLDGTKEAPFRLLAPRELFDANGGGGGRALTARRTEVPIGADLFLEGMEYQTLADFRRRHPELVRAAKMEYRAVCRVCDFDFETTYGELGKDYIEMHHLEPIAEGERMSRVDDLRPVCANCHRILHRNPRTVLSIEELRSKIGKA